MLSAALHTANSSKTQTFSAGFGAPPTPSAAPAAAVSAVSVPSASRHVVSAAGAEAGHLAPLPMRITRYQLSPEQVPVDFFADPDGAWEFAALVEMAGFNPEHPGASVGALTKPFDGYPEGAAVITEVGVGCRYVAIAELPARADSQAQSTSPSRRQTTTRRVSPRLPHRAA